MVLDVTTALVTVVVFRIEPVDEIVALAVDFDGVSETRVLDVPRVGLIVVLLVEVPGAVPLTLDLGAVPVGPTVVVALVLPVLEDFAVDVRLADEEGAPVPVLPVTVILVELEVFVDVELADLERDPVPVPPVPVIFVEVEEALVVTLADEEGKPVPVPPVTVILVELDEVLDADVELTDLDRDPVPVPPVLLILVELEVGLAVDMVEFADL